MALLAASSSIACASIRCAQAPGATNLARSAASCPPPQLTLAPSALPLRPMTSELMGGSAMAAALFASLASADSAMAAQEIMSLAADDNRGLALLLPLIPAIGWVLFNILQPALSQLDRMKSAKGLAVGLGLGAVSSLLIPSRAEAVAQELASLGAAADNDSRGLLVLLVLVPAVGWVLFNILKPALIQLDRMKSVKGVLGAAGLSAALLLASAPAADAAVQEVASLADGMRAAADSDARGLVLVASLVPALGWVLFNILQPGLSQLDRMKTSKGIAVGLGLGSAAAAAFSPLRSEALEEISTIATSNNDSRGILLLGVLIPAIGWVLFNILQPALNQFDKTRAQK